MIASRLELAGHRGRGFTLIELICCLVIIGILAAAAGPRIFDNSSFNAHGYAQEVADAIHEAQAVAVASNCPAEITINAASYSAMQQPAAGNTCGPGGWVTPIRRSDGTALSGTAPNGITAAPFPMQIVFNGAGQVTNGTPAPLTIAPFTLTINRDSGLVLVQ